MLQLLQTFHFVDKGIDHVCRFVAWAELPHGAAMVDLCGGADYMAT